MNWVSRNISNFLLLSLVVLFLYRQAPLAFKHWRIEGKPIPDFSVSRLDGSVFNSSESTNPHVIVFWATWCGPCSVELSRIQKLIDAGKIASGSVTAISSYEERSVVAAAVRERGYTFGIGLDPDGIAGETMGVTVTPTIVFRDSRNTISWISSGVSPSLGMRIERFLRSE